MLRAVHFRFAFAFACLAFVVTPSASAAPIECPPGSVPDPSSGRCVISATDPGGGSTGGPKTPGDSGRSSSPIACTYVLNGKPKKIPCSAAGGWWSQDQQAYCKVANPQPPLSDPIWAGRMDGQVYDCTRSVDPRVVGVIFQVWLAVPPRGAPPDPRQLARSAIATMNLQAVSIGIVPEANAGSVGLVGMPVWLWDSDTSAASWGPVVKTAATGGYSVTATAKVSRVVWSMGDGEVVVCRTRGTPYADSFGKRPSPDCGYMYETPGRFTVRATSYWKVQWAGMGQSGSIPLQFSDTVGITVGEVQVLTQ